MSAWTKWRNHAVEWILGRLGLSRAAAAGAAAAGAVAAAGCEDAAVSRPPAWDKATKASCWFENAAHRTMNVLSPGMPDAVFAARLAEMRSRGVDTAHVILCNQADGEFAGYSPWGAGRGPSAATCDAATVSHMVGRIRRLRSEGWAVVVWVVTDDSAAWCRALAASAGPCMQRLSEAGLFEDASIVVAGLEMDEYWSAAEAGAVVAALRRVYAGKIGTHHLSHRAPFASLGDILFYQVERGRSASQIAADVAAAKKAGKPVCMFELDRNPNRALCEAALRAGAFAVGNW